MATQKVSLTLDREVLEAARERVVRRCLSSSVFSAFQLILQNDRILTLLAELDAEYGPVDERTKAEVRREWQDANTGVRHKRRER
jgi:hypothetical protein